MAGQKKYIDSVALQYLLEKLRDKNKELFLGKMAEAASAAKVNHALTLTVGENDVVFDGSEVKSAAVAAKVHKHTHADITDFDAAVKKAAFGDEHATMTAHTHDNKAVLDTVSADRVGKWDAKISVDDVAKIKYENTGMTSVKDVKGALDVLVANVQIAAGQLTETSRNMDAVKKVADDAAKAAAAEKTRAEGKEGELKTAIDAINNVNTGILKQAKDYADGKDAAIAAAKKAGDDAQKDVDALELKVGTVPADKTVIGLIGEAKAQADKGVADAAAEAGRAQSVEAELREDLGQATDAADAEGSAFARIAQVKADLGAEVTRATGIEEGLRTDVDANKAAIEILNGDDQTAGSVKKQIADKIAEVNQAAGNFENRIKANEDAIKVINGDGEGSIKKAVADLVNGAPEAMNTLSELASAIEAHQEVYEGYIQTVASNIATAKQEAITEAGKLDTALHNTITGEISTAKTEAISAAAEDATGKVSALENKLQPKIDAKVAQADYDTKVAALEKADADNLAAAIKHADDEDAKIEAILGHKAEGDLTATGLCKDVADNAAAITAEATARQDADKLLSDRIAKFESGDNSVAAQVQGVKDALDTFKEDQAAKDESQDTNITANKNAIDAVKGRLDTAESKLNVIQGEGEGSIKKAVADAKSDIKNVTDGLGTRIDGLDTRVTALEATVNTATTGLKARMTAAETDINKLKSDMTAAQGDINGINNNITTIQNTLKNLVPLTDGELMAMLNQVYAK